MNQPVVSAKQFLLRTYAVSVPDEWLIACVDYILENPDLAENINHSVYIQWLHSDLSQLEHSCLPKDLFTKDSCVLTGKYCVQVNTMMDISQSSYSQLQKCKGRELDEAEEPATDWKRKKESPKRMLKLELTDGVSTVFGIEYQPIPCLTLEGFVPGCKLQLTGHIVCKRGAGMPRNVPTLLMLTADNVVFLGGEVESFVDEKNVVKELERRLRVKPSTTVQQLSLSEQLNKTPAGSHTVSPTVNRTNPNLNTNNVKPKTNVRGVEASNPPRQLNVVPVQPRVSPGQNSLKKNVPRAREQPTVSISPFTANGQPELESKSVHQQRSGTIVTQSMPVLSGSTIATSIGPISTPYGESFGNTSNIANVVNASYYDDDDEDMLKAVACIEENMDDENCLPFPTTSLSEATNPGQLENSALEINHNNPFSYLSTSLNSGVSSRFVIKGFILSTVGKLEFSGANAFGLKVRVADAKAKVDCTVSQEMIGQLLGFSVAQGRHLYSLATTNKDPAARKKLSEGISRLKYKLVTMSGLLTIERSRAKSPGSPSFELVHCAEPTLEDCQFLMERVDAKLRGAV